MWVDAESGPVLGCLGVLEELVGHSLHPIQPTTWGRKQSATNKKCVSVFFSPCPEPAALEESYEVAWGRVYVKGTCVRGKNQGQ
jgi:hypothetical protein